MNSARRTSVSTAGTALGAWRADPVKAWQGRDVARLLIHAGADEALVQGLAEQVAAVMPRRNACRS